MMVLEGFRPILGPRVRLHPIRDWLHLCPQLNLHSCPTLSAALALSLALAKVSHSSPVTLCSPPSPTLSSNQRLLEIERTSCIPPRFESYCPLV